jgi:hypothetical protein
MLSQHSRSSKLAFGPFEFDPGSGELFRHGSRVRLASQPGTVLDTLVDRPGELVTCEDLRNRLWPGATSGDFEHGLNAAINKLRQTLGDIANQPHYIETLPGVDTASWRRCRPYFVTLQLTVLRAQKASLKAAHRKQQAKHVEDQIARIEADSPAACIGCTVSASALMSPGMQ